MRLIDADALIKELEEEAKSLEKESFEIKENTVLKSNLRGRADGIRDALIEMINAPTVEPKTGHWIMTHDYFTGAYESIDYVKCSCCGEDSLEMGDYCPNCGAKMVETYGEDGR